MSTRRTTALLAAIAVVTSLGLSACEGLEEADSTKAGKVKDVNVGGKAGNGEKEQTVEADIKGDGTWIIPKDVKPGIYVAPEIPGSCYWERVKGLSGNFNDLIANDNAEGQAVVEIKAGDKGFTTTDCGGWVKIDKIPKDPQKAISGDGTWLVGTDIVAGTYRAKGAGSCYWERLSDFTGGMSGLLANDNPKGQTIVRIMPTDRGFSTADCGGWEKIG